MKTIKHSVCKHSTNTVCVPNLFTFLFVTNGYCRTAYPLRLEPESNKENESITKVSGIATKNDTHRPALDVHHVLSHYYNAL